MCRDFSATPTRAKGINRRVLKFAGCVQHYNNFWPHFEKQGGCHGRFSAKKDSNSAYISLITGPGGLACEATLLKIMGWKSDVFRFDLEPLFQGQTRQGFITHLLLVLEVWDVKPINRNSWDGNLLVWSHLTLGPLLQGETRIAKLKSAHSSLIIGSRGWRLKVRLKSAYNSCE